MKYLLLALALTAVSGQFQDADTDLDALLEADLSLPCTPKPCVPVCKTVTKYLAFGSFKLPYTENECKPDPTCLAAAAACVKKLQAAMVDAHKKATALEAASKAKNSAHATKQQKDAAAKKKEAEAAAAKNALIAAKKLAVVAQEEAAAAVASNAITKKTMLAKKKIMDVRVAAYENAKKAHLAAVAAYDGAKSAAAKAAIQYKSAVNAHCSAEAQHAAAVKKIGHGHLAQKNCAQYNAPKCKSTSTAVAYDGYLYRTLSGAPVAGATKYDHKEEQKYLKMPHGYSVAPNSPVIAHNVIAKHKWNVWRMCTQSKCYAGLHYGGSAGSVKNSHKMWDNHGDHYRITPTHNWYKLLVRSRCASL